MSKYRYEVGIRHPTKENVEWVKDLTFREPLVKGHLVDIRVKPEDFKDKPAYESFPDSSNHWIYNHRHTIWILDRVIHCPSSKRRSRVILIPKET